jgi:hypothetical protein
VLTMTARGAMVMPDRHHEHTRKLVA